MMGELSNLFLMFFREHLPSDDSTTATRISEGGCCPKNIRNKHVYIFGHGSNTGE
jgi:hypothetical protein